MYRSTSGHAHPVTSDPAEDAGLLARLADLEQRVRALEQHRSSSADPAPPNPTAPDPAPSDAGVVRYSGEVTLHGRVTWSIALDARVALQLPDEPRLAVLAALAHPARAGIVRTLLIGGLRGTTELLAAAGLASTGQLYHHLRALTHSGLVEQDGRGSYRVAPPLVGPVLVLLTAAADAAGQLR